MDLALVMEKLRPGENVSPDLSSYNQMVIHWRGSGSPPSLVEVEAQWVLLEPEVTKITQEQVVDKELIEAGAGVKAMVDALWEKVMDGSTKKADDLKVVIDQIK